MKLMGERYEIRANVKCMRIVVTIDLYHTLDLISSEWFLLSPFALVCLLFVVNGLVEYEMEFVSFLFQSNRNDANVHYS